jgi:hypothetical protein
MSEGGLELMNSEKRIMNSGRVMGIIRYSSVIKK